MARKLEHLPCPIDLARPLGSNPTYRRDPALIYDGGVLRCFHTAVDVSDGRYDLFVDVTETADLANWSAPRRLTEKGLNFSSPGNIIRHDNQWIMCVQSYPIPPGEVFGSEDSRLWLMRSDDLCHWSPPRLLQAEGSQAQWARRRGSARQIDPYIVRHDGRWWCFYKTEGELGLMVSSDMVAWSEACPDRPVLCRDQTPDGATVENPCIVHDGESFVMFFSPCRKGRGVGTARSDDLLTWRDVRYLDFPPLTWAPGGPTAAMVLDVRRELGAWLMGFHGDAIGPHNAMLGTAWSDDLEHWALT